MKWVNLFFSSAEDIPVPNTSAGFHGKSKSGM